MVEALEQEGLIRKREPYTHTVPFSHRSGERIEPLISLQWFMRMDELAAAGDRGRARRPRAVPSRPLGARLPRLAREHPALVHLAPAVVGPPAAGLVLRRVRRDLRQRRAARALRHLRRRAAARRGRARHLVLVGAVAVRDARLAGRHAGAARVLPDRRARHRAGHHLPVGRAHGDDGARVPAATCRSPTSTSRRSSRRPTAGACRSRSAPASTRSTRSRRTAPTRCASACWRCRRPRTCATRAEKIQQGQQLANKMWNASRLVLLNAADVEPAPRPRTVEDRWILSRLQRAIARWREQVGAYDFSHAALDLYSFFYGDFCDWYLEMVKPRLYEQEEEVSATLLHVLGQTLALAHPMLPFVTEEIHSFMPGAGSRSRREPFPRGRRGAAGRGGGARGGRGDRGGAAVAQLPRLGGRAAVRADPRAARGRSATSDSLDAIGRLARFDITTDGSDGEVVSSIGLEGATVEVLPSDTVDPAEARARIEAERDAAARRDRTGARKAREQGVHGQGAATAGPDRAGEAGALRSRAGRAGGVVRSGALPRRRARCATPSATSTRSRCSACASGSSGCGG